MISEQAKAEIDQHIERMRSLGCKVEQLPLPDTAALGTFVPPTIIELKQMSDLTREVFGPVLHVIRYRREDLDRLIDDINNSGYGLTFGLHTRLDETIEHVTGRVKAGNLYVNRNIIGAVVGVQPLADGACPARDPRQAGHSTSAVSYSARPSRRNTVRSIPTLRFAILHPGWAGKATTPKRKQRASLPRFPRSGSKRNWRDLWANETSMPFIQGGGSSLRRQRQRAFSVSLRRHWPPETRL
ncbi:hypothetical protein AJ87_46225 [Rhizobium yanglingense]|nr:hypothetical protein AJ87_46225 [Rhizobium yanglingense]